MGTIFFVRTSFPCMYNETHDYRNKEAQQYDHPFGNRLGKSNNHKLIFVFTTT